MRKYKKIIEINYANMAEVLQVPIVDGIEKERFGTHWTGYGELYATSSVVGLVVSGYEQPFAIGTGNVLALDVCDNWHAFSKKEWIKHIDDVI